jgi:hypothetical protein
MRETMSVTSSTQNPTKCNKKKKKEEKCRLNKLKICSDGSGDGLYLQKLHSNKCGNLGFKSESYVYFKKL